MGDFTDWKPSDIEAKEQQLWEQLKFFESRDPNGATARSARRAYDRFLEKTKHLNP